MSSAPGSCNAAAPGEQCLQSAVQSKLGSQCYKSSVENRYTGETNISGDLSIHLRPHAEGLGEVGDRESISRGKKAGRRGRVVASAPCLPPHTLNLAMSRPSSRNGGRPRTPVVAVRSFERPEPAQIISKHSGTVLEDGLDAEKVCVC